MQRPAPTIGLLPEFRFDNNSYSNGIYDIFLYEKIFLVEHVIFKIVLKSSLAINNFEFSRQKLYIYISKAEF